MTVLLDENFPLALLRALLADGEAAEHIITLGLDAVRRLRREGRPERRFELMDSGYLQPWHYGPKGVWLAK